MTDELEDDGSAPDAQTALRMPVQLMAFGAMLVALSVVFDSGLSAVMLPAGTFLLVFGAVRMIANQRARG